MNAKSLELLAYARQTVARLSTHVVLGPLWDDLCIILKGSTSRGNADAYSDIDLVIYCTEAIRARVVAGYFANQLSDRQDGIFIPLENGHYHVESFDQLRGYFLQRDYLHCWDYQNAIPLHDPAGIYAAIIEEGKQALFAAPLPGLKRAYLDLQLDLDWMRMPIQRRDGPSALLHMAKILSGVSRMAYLLERQPYPPDKWLFTFLPATAFGREHGEAIQTYFHSCPAVLDLPENAAYERHPLYTQAIELVGHIAEHIRARHGEQPWLGPWYNYV
jgi:hypothetical protein